MKLSDYFHQQKSQKIPSSMKEQIFSRIQNQKIQWIEISTKISTKMFSIISKRMMYVSLSAILVFIVFWGLLLDRNQIIDFWFFSVNQNNNPNEVLADYIAEIVEFNWEYSLVRDWKMVLDLGDLKLIQDWDVVNLPEWTDIIFYLDDWTQAKIVWPAEFSISKTEKWYQISLFDGKFFRIYCPDCESDIEIVTPDVSIYQEKDQVLDLHIAKEDDGEILVKNDGWVATVKIEKSWKSSEIKELPKELVAIDSDSEEMNVVDNSNMMVAFMQKNNISATFTLSATEVDWPVIKAEDVNKQIAVNTNLDKQTQKVQPKQESQQINLDNEKDKDETKDDSDLLLEWIMEVVSSDTILTWKIDEDIALQLWLSNDGQQVPSNSQMQNLKTNLNSFFLMNLFESIYNQDKVEQNIAKLADRLNSIANAFGYQDHANPDLNSIKSASLSLKNKLEEDWYISPLYILQLEKLSKWCDELQNPSQDSWEDLKSDLPINLRLM